jgi:hypothetical protein
MAHLYDIDFEPFSEELNVLLEEVAVREHLSAKVLDAIHLFTVELYRRNLITILNSKVVVPDEGHRFN